MCVTALKESAIVYQGLVNRQRGDGFGQNAGLLLGRRMRRPDMKPHVEKGRSKFTAAGYLEMVF